MDRLKEEILSYKFDGRKKHLFDEYGADTIISTSLAMLDELSGPSSPNPDGFQRTIFYICDMSVCDLTDDDYDEYIRALGRLQFFVGIEKYLYHEIFSIAGITIHMMGKLYMKENAVYLERAFETSYENNAPIRMMKCLQELGYLQSGKTGAYVARLECSNNLLNKLALCMLTVEDEAYRESLCRILDGYGASFAGAVRKIPRKEFTSFLYGYEILIINVTGMKKVPDFDPGGYTAAFLYYCINHKTIFNGAKEDLYGTYSAMYRDIQNFNY